MAGEIVTSQKRRASVDQMDRGMDMLHTVMVALQSPDLDVGGGDVERISNALAFAIEELEPCRELLNRSGEKLPDFDAGKAVQP